jgi:hypothetical protein
MEWSDSMDQLAARRRTGRFTREPAATEPASQDLLKH